MPLPAGISLLHCHRQIHGSATVWIRVWQSDEWSHPAKDFNERFFHFYLYPVNQSMTDKQLHPGKIVRFCKSIDIPIISGSFSLSTPNIVFSVISFAKWIIWSYLAPALNILSSLSAICLGISRIIIILFFLTHVNSIDSSSRSDSLTGHFLFSLSIFF